MDKEEAAEESAKRPITHKYLMQERGLSDYHDFGSGTWGIGTALLEHPGYAILCLGIESREDAEAFLKEYQEFNKTDFEKYRGISTHAFVFDLKPTEKEKHEQAA